jgi:hypothetical protein
MNASNNDFRSLASPSIFEEVLDREGVLTGRVEWAEETGYDKNGRKLNFEGPLRALVLMHITSYESLQDEERIMALLMVVTLSLLVYSTLEWRIRKGLHSGLAFPDQKGNATQRPTAGGCFRPFVGSTCYSTKVVRLL